MPFKVIKNMNKLTTACFVFLGLLSCNSLKEKTDNSATNNHKKTIVYGKIIHQTAETPKVITVLACDPLNDKDRYATKLDSSGIFRSEFEMLWGHTFTINYFDDYINVYANPGDSIYIEIDAAEFYKDDKNGIRYGKNGVHFKGDNGKRNNEFRQICNNFINRINYDVFNDMTLPIDEFMKIFDKERTRINDAIAVYCKENNISQWTQNLMQYDMLFSLANYVVDYEGQSSKEALDFFAHPILDIYNDKNFCTMMFDSHLSAYYYHMIMKDSTISDYYQTEKFLDVEKLALRKLLELPKCLSRDYMLAKLYADIKINADNIDKNIFHNKDVYNKVLELQRPFQPAELPEIKSEKGAFYMTSEGKVENVVDFNFESLIKEKHKGKVVYMDIWASWCGPCRTQMASAHELHKLFKSKDVVFINICMASSQKHWIKVLDEYTVSGENYFFNSDLSAEASAKLLSGGYPTYILIDKKAKIRIDKAPRPSNLLKAKDAIEKLLLEK